MNALQGPGRSPDCEEIFCLIIIFGIFSGWLGGRYFFFLEISREWSAVYLGAKIQQTSFLILVFRSPASTNIVKTRFFFNVSAWPLLLLNRLCVFAKVIGNHLSWFGLVVARAPFYPTRIITNTIFPYGISFAFIYSFGAYRFSLSSSNTFILYL